MITGNNDGKFMRIVSNGYVPFNLPQESKFDNMPNCHPKLINISNTDFYYLVEQGKVVPSYSNEQQIGEMYIRPELRFGSSVMHFSPNIFLSDPIFIPRIDNNALTIFFDLRIDLKKWVRPNQMAEFTNSIKSNLVTDIGWTYECTSVAGVKKTSRMICKQDISNFKFELFATKKELITAC
jgi:hypothetical protein